MSEVSITINRMLIAVERSIRMLNREILNPEIPRLTLESMEPALRLVARVRGKYLKAILELAESCEDSVPDEATIADLRTTRECYDELVLGTQALETAIKRGYLDVEGIKTA